MPYFIAGSKYVPYIKVSMTQLQTTLSEDWLKFTVLLWFFYITQWLTMFWSAFLADMKNAISGKGGELYMCTWISPKYCLCKKTWRHKEVVLSALYINLINNVANNANNLIYIVRINSYKNILLTEHLALKAESKRYKYVAE